MEEKETRVCTFRDLWHMVVVPQAISYRTSLKSHADADTPGKLMQFHQKNIRVPKSIQVA